MLILANADDLAGSGIAYFYRRVGTNWVQETALLVPNISNNNYVGYAGSLSGNRAIVGAMFDNEVAERAGAAYIYRFDGSGWVEEAKLIASDAEYKADFGTHVAIDGDTVVVAAPGNSTVYFFRRDGTTWIEEDKKFQEGLGSTPHTSESAAIDGEVAVVGSSGFDTGRGSASVYRRTGSGQWAEEAMLLASDGRSADTFGSSVSIEGDLVIVGAWRDGPEGSAYVYRRDGQGD